MINPNISPERQKEIAAMRQDAVLAEMRHFEAMSPSQYTAELTELIENAGQYLSDDDATAVLQDAFNLIKTRLGIRFEVRMVRGVNRVPCNPATYAMKGDDL